MEGQANECERCAIIDFRRLDEGTEIVDQRLNGTVVSVESKNGPGKTPECMEGFGATLQPVEARGSKVVQRLSEESEQGYSRRVGMWSESRSIDDTIAGVPAPLRTNSVVQHFHAAPHTKLQQIRFRTSMDLS